jgi:hypothetical protein
LDTEKRRQAEEREEARLEARRLRDELKVEAKLERDAKLINEESTNRIDFLKRRDYKRQSWRRREG